MNLKFLLSLALFILSFGVISAETGDKSLVFRIGYQSNYEKVGLSCEGRYEIVPNVRIAPDVAFFFPKHKYMGFNLNTNIQYTFNEVLPDLTIYPLAGINIINNMKSFWGQGYSYVGLNLGGGAELKIDNYSFINIEMKAAISEKSYGQVMIGYGINF